MRPTMSSTMISLPESKYLRPVISPSAAEAQSKFAQICRSGDYEKVVKIVESETRTQQYLTQGLCAAIFQKDLRIAETLLDKVVSINSDILVAAACAQSQPILELLLDRGWDINAPFIGNETMLTSVLASEELTLWFLDHGAKPDILTSSSSTGVSTRRPGPSASCLDVAAQCSTVAVFDLLAANGASRENSNPLHSAAQRSDDDRESMVSHLIALGYDVNVTDVSRGNHSIGTPLHYAIMANYPSTVHLLLQKGADPHKPVGRCGSAYKMAELLGRSECVTIMKRSLEVSRAEPRT